MNIDEKGEMADTAIPIWPEMTVISRKTVTARTIRRRRAAARVKWPMYLPDVAYRIERLPQPRRAYGRTWKQLAHQVERGPAVFRGPGGALPHRRDPQALADLRDCAAVIDDFRGEVPAETPRELSSGAGGGR